MAIWMAVLVALLWLFFTTRRARGLERNYDVVLELSSPVRVTLRSILWLMRIGGVVVCVGAVTGLPLIGNADDPVVALGAGLLVVASAAMLAQLLRLSNIRASRDGLSFFLAFVPWNLVDRFSVDHERLIIVTPSLRRAWNGWSGSLEAPLRLWRTPDEELRRLRELSNESRRGAN